MKFSMVIEDDLAKELCCFKKNEKYDQRLVEKILHYYKPHPIFSKELMKEYYDSTTLTQIAQNISPLKTDEDKLKYTTYKIILSKTKSNFPYVNINNVDAEKIENNFSATFMKGEDRTKAKEHFKSLFKEAKEIFIYDRYAAVNHDGKLNEKNWQAFQQFLNELLPKKQLNLYVAKNCQFNTKKQDLIQSIKQQHPDWNIKEDKALSNLHDRYIIIDDKVMIILTSGIYHLMNDKKDFTYIIRKYPKIYSTK